MYPMLILREELLCLILLGLLALISHSFRMGQDGRAFHRLLSLAAAHVALDGLSVYSVNHPGFLSSPGNDFVHALLFVSAVLFAAEIMIYILCLIYPERKKVLRALTLGDAGLYLFLILCGLLRFSYVPRQGTYTSGGSAAAAGFALAFLCLLVSLLALLWRRDLVSPPLRRTLLPILLVLIGAEIAQILVRELLFTGAAVTLASLAFFFSLENPAAVLDRRARMDALMGMGSRASYDRDMQAYDEMFTRDKSLPFTFLFVDINNLRSVNGLYGHQAGDDYISQVALLLVKSLKGAEHIYRMGGDEFLAVYRNQPERVLLRDMDRATEAVQREKDSFPAEPELVMGYAASDEKYRSLRDVLRVADYMMYRNKANLKLDHTLAHTREGGTVLNLSGLTDRVFDAMCLTSEEVYPFLTNLETNVTRISPGMAEVFGLEHEFFADFEPVWTSRIHPDDLDAYQADLAATMQGKQQYHFCRYRALTKSGAYVQLTCRGGIYHGRGNEADIFTGYIVNHGAPELVDAVTGLQNETAMENRLRQLLREEGSGVLLRLEIQNVTRIRMLYGREACDTVLRRLGGHLLTLCRDRGDVYCISPETFILILTPGKPDVAREMYSMIRQSSASGVSADTLSIPVAVLGSALVLPSEALKDQEAVRSASMYAQEEARQLQGDRLHFFSPEAMPGAVTGRVSLLSAVHLDAITARENFFLRYQPILRLRSGAVVGAEALLRWRSKELGEVSPTRFISLLESDPVYLSLGQEIIRKAVRQAAVFRRSLPDFRINVNITALQLLAEDFPAQVLHILREEDFPPEHLVLELTERCKELDFPFLAQKVRQLQETGIQVALDDMGTGFSTLDLLLHLPVNEVKLDHAFTRELRKEEKHRLYAQGLCQAAAGGAIEVCFEGVEEQETAEYLKTLGNVLSQGFLFDAPLLPEEFTARYC